MNITHSAGRGALTIPVRRPAREGSHLTALVHTHTHGWLAPCMPRMGHDPSSTPPFMMRPAVRRIQRRRRRRQERRGTCPSLSHATHSSRPSPEHVSQLTRCPLPASSPSSELLTSAGCTTREYGRRTSWSSRLTSEVLLAVHGHGAPRWSWLTGSRRTTSTSSTWCRCTTPARGSQRRPPSRGGSAQAPSLASGGTRPGLAARG